MTGYIVRSMAVRAGLKFWLGRRRTDKHGVLQWQRFKTFKFFTDGCAEIGFNGWTA